MSAIETATLNELIIEIIRLTKHPLCIHQDDAMGCYDRIIRTNATINSRKFGIPDNIYKLHQTAHDRMEFKNQINNNTSQITYKSTKRLPMHGQGQGAGNGETHWMFISVPMMEIVDKVAPGCTIQLPKGKATWKIRMMVFVNDKRHYTNTLHQQLSAIVIRVMKKSVSTWYELLLFVGGDLKLFKCGWYVIDWGLDRNDKPCMQQTNHSLWITTPAGSLHYLFYSIC